MLDAGIGRVLQAKAKRCRARAPIDVLRHSGAKQADLGEDVAPDEHIGVYRESPALDIATVIERENKLKGLGGRHSHWIIDGDDHSPSDHVCSVKRAHAAFEPIRHRSAILIRKGKNFAARNGDGGVARLGRSGNRGRDNAGDPFARLLYGRKATGRIVVRDNDFVP